MWNHLGRHQPGSGSSYFPRAVFSHRGWGRSGFTSGEFQSDYQLGRRNQNYGGYQRTERLFHRGRGTRHSERGWSGSQASNFVDNDGDEIMEKESWNAVETPVNYQPEYHCKCCPMNSTCCNATSSKSSRKVEIRDMRMQQDVQRERFGGSGNRGRHHYGYGNHRGHGHNALNAVANPSIARRRAHFDGFRGGRGNYQGRLSKNQLKLRRAHQRQAYWRQLQDNLNKGDRGRQHGVDLKSDSAVELSLDDIILKTNGSGHR